MNKETEKQNIILLMGFSLAFIALYFLEPFKTFPPFLIFISETTFLVSIIFLILAQTFIKRKIILKIGLTLILIGISSLLFHTIALKALPSYDQNQYFLFQHGINVTEARGIAYCTLSSLGLEFTSINETDNTSENNTWKFTFNIANKNLNVIVQNRKYLNDVIIESGDRAMNATRNYYAKCLPQISGG